MLCVSYLFWAALVSKLLLTCTFVFASDDAIHLSKQVSIQTEQFSKEESSIEIDLGRCEVGKRVTADIEFFRDGDSPIELTFASAECGCISVVDGKEKNKLTISINPVTGAGKWKKSVKLQIPTSKLGIQRDEKLASITLELRITYFGPIELDKQVFAFLKQKNLSVPSQEVETARVVVNRPGILINSVESLFGFCEVELNREKSQISVRPASRHNSIYDTVRFSIQENSETTKYDIPIRIDQPEMIRAIPRRVRVIEAEDGFAKLNLTLIHANGLSAAALVYSVLNESGDVVKVIAADDVLIVNQSEQITRLTISVPNEILSSARLRLAASTSEQCDEREMFFVDIVSGG